MRDITRFNQDEEGWMSTDGDGDWVKYEDAQELIAALEKELAEKTKALEFIETEPLLSDEYTHNCLLRSHAGQVLAKYNNT